MADGTSGSERFNDEDRLYAGSRFRDVVNALFMNPYQKVWGREGEPPLPAQDTTIKIFDPGDPVAKRTLTFTIDVTDEGHTSETPFRVRRTFPELAADRHAGV